MSWYAEHAAEVNAFCVGLALGLCGTSIIVRREIRRTGNLYIESAKRILECGIDCLAMTDRLFAGEPVSAEEIKAMHERGREAVRKAAVYKS